MATIEDFIFTRLTEDSLVAAVVGNKVYRGRMPDNPGLPAIVYAVIQNDVIESRKGFSGLRCPTVGIECMARTSRAAETLAELVRAALHGHSGDFEDLIIHNILEWEAESAVDGGDYFEEETGIFTVACSCRLWYS
jgi:hypothetical protein